MKQKRKKAAAWLLCAALALSLAACGGDGGRDTGNGIQAFTDLDGKTIAVNNIPAPPEELKGYFSQAYELDFAEVKSVPSVMEATMLVQNGQADGALTPVAATAEYFARENDGLRAVISDFPTEIAIALDAEETALLEELNGAIDGLKEDGTLEKLVETWITGITSDGLKVEPIPQIEGADTLVIGISGDAAPLDYVSADGSPAGFNVALMTEIGRRLDKNVAFEVVPTDAKFTSILSKRIDAFFWHVSILPLPNTIAATDSYFSTSLAAIVRD